MQVHFSSLRRLKVSENPLSHNPPGFDCGSKFTAHSCDLYAVAGQSSLYMQRSIHSPTFIYKAILCLSPSYLWVFMASVCGHQYGLRSKDSHSSLFQTEKAFRHAWAEDWHTNDFQKEQRDPGQTRVELFLWTLKMDWTPFNSSFSYSCQRSALMHSVSELCPVTNFIFLSRSDL